MKISEIFYSIDGEGRRCGEPAVFIRTVGCNLACPWCDTKYSWGNGDSLAREMTIEEIVDEVATYNCKQITLTGGEPLITPDIDKLIAALHDYEINIETNGAVDISPFVDFDNVFFTIDYKALSSKQNEKMLANNYQYLTYADVVKCVVANKQDMVDFVNYITDRAKDNEILHCIPLYISPVFGEIDPVDIVNFVMYDAPKDYNYKVHLQMHKIIWDKNKRGV
jgi:7-carboxy-7-deazaguanine synthase